VFPPGKYTLLSSFRGKTVYLARNTLLAIPDWYLYSYTFMYVSIANLAFSVHMHFLKEMLLGPLNVHFLKESL